MTGYERTKLSVAAHILALLLVCHLAVILCGSTFSQLEHLTVHESYKVVLILPCAYAVWLLADSRQLKDALLRSGSYL